MMVTSKEGLFHYKSSPKSDGDVPSGSTCGLYLITDPERQIEIEMLHMDVSCEDGGLVSVSSLSTHLLSAVVQCAMHYS